jgi:hypothetical protein
MSSHFPPFFKQVQNVPPAFNIGTSIVHTCVISDSMGKYLSGRRTDFLYNTLIEVCTGREWKVDNNESSEILSAKALHKGRLKITL